jgi:hypothetical protein
LAMLTALMFNLADCLGVMSLKDSRLEGWYR